MDIIVITTTDGVFVGIVRSCNLQLWAEQYQAENGFLSYIAIYDDIDCMTIGTQNFKLLYQSP